MFNGAYLITEVNHTISPGQFQTSFTGVRQRIFASEKPNNYLMSLNQNLLQKLPSELREAQSSPSTGKVNQTSATSNAARKFLSRFCIWKTIEKDILQLLQIKPH